jgi:hypothetical protein
LPDGLSTFAFEILAQLAGEPQRCFFEDEPLAELHETIVAELDLPAVALTVKGQAAILPAAALSQRPDVLERPRLATGVGAAKGTRFSVPGLIVARG